MIKEITATELNTERFIDEKVKEIKDAVREGTAINALSGGVIRPDGNARFRVRVIRASTFRSR